MTAALERAAAWLDSAEARWPTVLAVIVLGGALLRVAWAAAVPVIPISDGAAYVIYATNLIDHGVYGLEPDRPGAYWSVGMPALLAGLWWLFDTRSFVPLVALQCVLSIALIGQVFVLAREYFGMRAGLIAAGLIAAWPSLIMYTSLVAAEAVFLAAMLAGWIAFIHAGGPGWRGWLPWVGAGVLLGLACYIRPIALLLPIVLGATRIYARPAAWRSLGLGAAVTLITIIAVLAPWTARNAAVLGKPVLVSTNLGPNLWMGNHPGTSGTYKPLPAWTHGMDEITRDEALKAEVVGYILEEPGAFIARTAWKAVLLHRGQTIAVVWNGEGLAPIGEIGITALKVLASGFWYAVLIAALAGTVLLIRREGLFGAAFHPVLAGWAYLTAVHAVIVVGDRYHFPSIPVIAILAALALATLLAGRRDAPS